MSYARCNKVWQILATVGAPIITTLLVLRWWQHPPPDTYVWLCWLHLPLTMFHETEEYVFPGGFVQHMNTFPLFAKKFPGENEPLKMTLIYDRQP